MTTAKTGRAAKPKDDAKVDDQVDPDEDETGSDEDDDEAPFTARELADAALELAKKYRGPRPAKKGDTVTFRRLGPCRAVLMDPSKILQLDGDVAKLKILEGRNKDTIHSGIPRYDRSNAIGPTDHVCPSWVLDHEEVSA